MVKRQEGFSLVELMITMVVFLLIIAAASGVFTSLLTQFKQQSKIAETNIEGAIGLEILRRDLESAGYGLAWNVGGATYSEALNDGSTVQNETGYNDSTSNPPRAFVSGNGEGSGGSDVLVVKAVNVATNAASSKWTHLFNGNTVREWTPATERLNTSDRVIVISPATRTLIVNGGSFTTRYAENGAAADNLVDAGFAPSDNTETRIVYGVTLQASPVGTALTMPFNRADFYIKTPTANFPSRCATGTGILYKGTISQYDGSNTPGAIGQELPLLDCVADMQVVYALDNDEDGDFVNGEGTPADAYTDNLTGLTAAQIRTRVKEIRAYVLSHEGQRDATYTYPNPTITVGPDAVLGRAFDLGTNLNYRWKVYTIVVRPNNSR